jgi:hypothetical protein
LILLDISSITSTIFIGKKSDSRKDQQAWNQQNHYASAQASLCLWRRLGGSRTASIAALGNGRKTWRQERQGKHEFEKSSTHENY